MNRFKITKIGLLNFWLYDEEEYDFYGGKLILRGTNGSGKSVTMQSFIPLILDGNKSPDRLDPFGSKERKIEDYIIGDRDSVQKEESTAYLYMETTNKENSYITIGLGFRGRKGKPTESWGFALKDGRRIGKDFFLYKDAANKIPLSKNELKSRLGPINEFTDTTRDYKEMVNRILFGFPNLDTYDEFIKLLLQLRSNKLSKDYKPTNLIQVLNTVLQPLTEEDLRPLSEAIEQMNKTKEQVEVLEKNAKALKDFLRVYQNYNELVLITKAKNLFKINKEYKDIKKELESLKKGIEEFRETLVKKKKRQQEVRNEIEINEENKRQLDNQDLKQKIETLSKLEKELEELDHKNKDIKASLSEKEEEILSLNTKINELDTDIYNLNKERQEYGIDIKSSAEASYFDEAIFFIDELNEHSENLSLFESIFLSIRSYSEKVNAVVKLLEEEQKIIMETETIRVEFERLTTSYKELEQKIELEEKNLKDAISKWEEDFIQQLNQNKYLILEEGTKKEIFTLMNDYETGTFLKVKSIYQDYASGLISNYTNTVLKLEIKKDAKTKEKELLEDEYQELEEKEDIELPVLNEETEKVLIENNIATIPLYKCIEFKQNLDEKVKNNIESTLLDLGLLNAKLVKNEDIKRLEKLNTQVLYLTKGTKKKNNLLELFDIKLESTAPIKEEDVKGVLESISISKEDDFCILENGLAKMEVLNSIADSKYQQTLIGYLKRKELKAKKLEELKEKIEEINKEITNITHLMEEATNKKESLRQETEKIPSPDIINQILEKIKLIHIELSYNDKRQKELEKTLKETDEKLKKVKEEIGVKKQGIYIPLNLSAYKEASSQIINLKEMIQNLKTIYNKYLNKMELKTLQKERLESTISNIEYLRAELDETEKRLNIAKATKKQINELLETKEYKNQKERLLKIESDLKDLNNEKEELIREISTFEADLKNQETNLSVSQEKEKHMSKLDEIYREIFLREYKLHYVKKEEIVDLEKTVREIMKEEKSGKERSLNEALNNFYSSYNHYSLELNDYSLRNITLFADYQEKEEEYISIYRENTRADVSAMYQGIKLNIIELSEKLESDIEENKILINKQDRHLFEDILLNTVGDKIRKRIDSSNEWVAKINRIMAQMQENSALSFKLVWKNVTADNEGEIDTKELVRILKMDPKLLKDSDTEKLTNHFRSKIKKAEELYQDSYISFYKIIEEVLDYRNWFTFQLFYQRKGMNLKELTDKTFSKFSGGERAKSMYIPLFASCYAKLNLAREDALRIIALDEAFAGVDEENIREMFGILKYLDIDFVINSQVLWGDYDTIEDLSICELIRPQNSQVVTVERYRWNGTYKEIINNRKEYNKELENA